MFFSIIVETIEFTIHSSQFTIVDISQQKLRNLKLFIFEVIQSLIQLKIDY